MFKKILIANRGEISVRIINTCKEMGIPTVAVYSDADKNALHVLKADEAVNLGEALPSESYLNQEKIIRAAKKTGAEAIHPGYGFLAENAEFASLCKSEGLVFIGPDETAIKKLGDKITARKMMIEAGVPVIQGMTLSSDNTDELKKHASKIGYPVLLKASAGGGGKGMRIVNSEDEIAEAYASASREALNAFGNGAVYLEKYLLKPRHIEFQILADSFGNIIHLNERECSIQRRYQKIIEETPSPFITSDQRKKMGEVAVEAARTSGYINAGTVEFIVDRDGNFYFLEMNTRLQVEHPVTECITGIDLVFHQIQIASGNKLSLKQEDISGRGHAIECRIYAEDPANNFMPSPGNIKFMKEPTGPGIRNDCGVYSGVTVPYEYDPILSKLVVHAENRETAIKKMICALREYIIIGITTPIPFLIDILKTEAFQKGDTFTDFIDNHFSDWKPEPGNTDLALIAYIIDEMEAKPSIKKSNSQTDEFLSPWMTLGNFRG